MTQFDLFDRHRNRPAKKDEVETQRPPPVMTTAVTGDDLHNPFTNAEVTVPFGSVPLLSTKKNEDVWSVDDDEYDDIDEPGIPIEEYEGSYDE